MITTVPEFIDPVFMTTRAKRSFSISDNEHFGLVFTKTGSINSGTGELGWKRRCFFENIRELEQIFELFDTFSQNLPAKNIKNFPFRDRFLKITNIFEKIFKFR
jgi:hypothetical protein